MGADRRHTRRTGPPPAGRMRGADFFHLPEQNKSMLFIKVICILGLFSAHACAAPTKTKRSLTLETYSIVLKDCSFSVKASIGGQVTIQDFKNGRAVFDTSEFEPGGSLTLNLKCAKGHAADYCTEYWDEIQSRREPDPLGIMRIRQYKGFHPTYYSDAYAKNFIGSPEPRVRYFNFCLGTEINVIEGSTSVNSEQHDKTQQAIKLLRTIIIN